MAGELIPEEDVVRLVEALRPLVSQVDGITTFEIITCLALAWFAEQGVEWAVVEVGLGGRLDATNVLDPALTVITSISYDHVAILGDTLTQIAGEKAGIIKPGVPLVSAPQPDEALATIRAVCEDQDVPLTLVGSDWTWQPGAADLDGQAFTIRHRGHEELELHLPLLGEHQVVNATTAIAAIALLVQGGLRVPAMALREGLRTVRWPGRLEILGREPVVIVDGAHNGDSARKLMAALQAMGGYRDLIVVIGGSADHLTPELMSALLSGAARAIATRSSHSRSAEPVWIQERAAELGFHVELSETVAQALDLALAEAGPQDLICCTGSLFVAGNAREAWFSRQGMPLPPCDPV